MARTWRSAHLCHVDESHGQGLIAQDGPVLVTLSPLQHDLQLVGISLQEMRVLPSDKQSQARLERLGPWWALVLQEESQSLGASPSPNWSKGNRGEGSVIKLLLRD